ncbi:CARP motif-containing protein [Cynara cardunculus var. scolymus]|uniref:TBCC domain-containing protein 1 n=1 Tax=Cynara cardunculus var. scolymus TaxID=59895 RepID=A0A103XPV5_CYNCS|nr:CARP motif-containing protein [Cynara cardunculus var. scolymus]
MTETPAAAPPPEQPSSPSPPPPVYIHPRREPFEHGLIPLQKLIFTDATQTLTSLRDKLLQHPVASNYPHRIDSAVFSETLQISLEHARLVFDIIASVHPSDSDPLVTAKPDEVDSVGVNVYDLIIFLYIQSYKRLLPKGHKDSAAVADVWPSTSAFDGFLSALTPLQLARSNVRRSMPSQADEEAHQLSYLQKHLGNIISLLADSVDSQGEGEDSLVLTMENFEHLAFLIYFGEKGSEKIPLSQNAPFFANSDPDMPAAPVPAAQVHDWIVQNISSAMEHISERAAAKENGPTNVSDQDAMMSDAYANTMKVSTSAKGSSSIEGISKQSYVKQASELKSSFVKIINCHESVIYLLAPLRYATIYGCSDATIVLGAVGKAVRIEHCERVHVISVAKRICIANCRECVFFLGVNQQPLIVGDNHKLQSILEMAKSLLANFNKIVGDLRYVQSELSFIKENFQMLKEQEVQEDTFQKSPIQVRSNNSSRFETLTPSQRLISKIPRFCYENKGKAEIKSTVRSKSTTKKSLAEKKRRTGKRLFQVAPYNTFYPQLEEHMKQVGVEASPNRWDEPIALGLVDPHDSLSHPAGIPNWFQGEGSGSTKDNPFPLPDVYMSSQQRNDKNLVEVKQILRETQLEDSRKRELSTALHVYFKDWLYASGNVRQLYCLQGE